MVLTKLVLCKVVSFKVVLFSIHTLLHLMLPMLVTILEIIFKVGLSGAFLFLPGYLQLKKNGFL
jgi:hypothetical protein